jgi:hypothetical protein
MRRRCSRTNSARLIASCYCNRRSRSNIFDAVLNHGGNYCRSANMSKGLDKKKEDKKKPNKTLKEKRAEKAAKKGGK